MKSAQCPIPKQRYDRVLLGHGSGGTLTQSLIDEIFYPAFSNPFLQQQHDGTVLPLMSQHIAFTTDSFVVSPLFFPGGNIGDLAVNGTVNDLLCCGATPLYLSAGFILEEGLPLEDLKKIVKTMAKAAEKAGITIVTGDTKVVEKGKCDGVFINTSGIGSIQKNLRISPKNATEGDIVIVTGPIGEHGVCILSTRENLGFESKIKSDTVALRSMVMNLLSGIPNIHMLRDATRGGIASALNEIADTAQVSIAFDESKIPIEEPVLSACELLGLDPLYVANEGVLLVILPPEEAESALQIIKNDPNGSKAEIIGEVVKGTPGEVYLNTALGSSRIIGRLSGEQLPRIC